jgi:hypothetical protein
VKRANSQSGVAEDLEGDGVDGPDGDHRDVDAEREHAVAVARRPHVCRHRRRRRDGGRQRANRRAIRLVDRDQDRILCYGVGNDWNGSVSRTVGTNQTIVHEFLARTGDTFWVQRLNGTVPLIGTLITLNDSAPTDHSWNFAAVEIIPMQRVPPPMTWPTPADIVYGNPARRRRS